MTLVGSAYAIGGGAKISAEALRMVAYQAANKGEGILDVGDLKVRALTTPGKSVLIGDGGGIVLNRSTGGEGQAYVFRNVGDESSPGSLADTGGSARSDMLVIRIEDPQYSPWPPLGVGVDPTTVQYVKAFWVTNVASSATKVMDLNSGTGLGYSAIAIARVDRPAGATTITNAQIVDLRKVARPRTQRELRPHAMVSAEAEILTNTTAEDWPNVAAWNIDVPIWATRMKILATWGGVSVPAGNVTGAVWVQIGAGGGIVLTQPVGYNSPGSTQAARTMLYAPDEITVPSAMRGTTQRFVMRGKVDTTSGASANLRLDGYSGLSLDVQFDEVAV